MKLIFTAFLLFLYCSAFAQEGWNDVTPADTYPGLLAVHAVGYDNAWVVGEEGTMLKTTDGGKTWESIQNSFTESINSVEFINRDTGWIAGPSNGSDKDDAVFMSTNGGATWNLQQLTSRGIEISITDLDFIRNEQGDSIWGFIAGGLASTFRTNDYGGTWEDLSGHCGEGNFWGCSFADKNTGWFVGYPSTKNPATIMRTTDGGNTFVAQTNPTDPTGRLRSVSFCNNQNGIAVGLPYTIITTTDGGANWVKRTTSIYRLNSVYLNQSGKAWAVGEDGTIAHSTDWGETWEIQQSVADCELWEVYFVDDNEGWIVGGGIGKPGVILHTTTGGVITKVKENNIVREFKLHQNYPNPFNPTTKIKYRIPESGLVTIKIYDVLGKEVASLINAEQPAGDYEYTFNAENLSSGIYYYNLRSGTYIATKKMVLLK